MSSFPVVPSAEQSERAKASLSLRYEDLTQDGQIKLTSLLQAVGSTGFAQLWVKHPLIATFAQGILPILTRLVIHTDASPTLLGAPLEALGGMQIAREENVAGQVQALLLNMFTEVTGPLGRSFGPQPEGAGTRVRLARVFAEHTFTKPFAAAGQRKVLSFDIPGQPAVPEALHTRKLLPELLAPEPEDVLLDADFIPDAAPWVFGMVHTDHNQHVNSLVYATLFENTALRRLSDHGVGTRLHAASIELVYRKPCFAGERMVCSVRAFTRDGEPGAVGYVAPAGLPPEKAHCALRLSFRRVP